jgi:hypothetical protein
MKIADLHALIAAVCPIQGVDSNGGIVFLPQTTPAQQAAAQSVMDANFPNLVL